MRQFLVESLLLSAAGGVAGVLLSGVALRAVLHADLPVPLPITLDVSLDWRVLAFTVLASVVAGVLFGLLPALQATRATVVETIKNENADGGPVRGSRFAMRSSSDRCRSRSRCSSPRCCSSEASRRARPSIPASARRRRACSGWRFPTDRYDSTKRHLLLSDIERRMARIPGVVSVGAIDNMLLNPLSQQSKRITVPGVTLPKGQTSFEVDFAAADSGLLGSIGLSVIRGRGITAAERQARRGRGHQRGDGASLLAGKDAIGQSFRTDSVVYQVVGVTRTTKVRSLGEEPRPFIITSLTQEFSPVAMIVARTNGDADRTATQMLATVREIDPTLMVIQVKTMTRHLAAMLLARSPGRDGVHAVRRPRARPRGARRLRRRELRGRASHTRGRHSSGRRRTAARAREIAHARGHWPRVGGNGGRIASRIRQRARASDAAVRRRER